MIPKIFFQRKSLQTTLRSKFLCLQILKLPYFSILLFYKLDSLLKMKPVKVYNCTKRFLGNPFGSD